jgi:hypothetical protein
MAKAPLGTVVHFIHQLAGTPADQVWTDQQLLERFAAARDEAAFATLVRRHGPLVLGACQRVLHNSHDAEDAFQATFLVLVHKGDSIRQRHMPGRVVARRRLSDSPGSPHRQRPAPGQGASHASTASR